MTCDELRQDYAAYALGVAGEPERTEIAEHVARQCAVCVAGVTSGLTTVAAMSGAVPIKEPPQHLRRRVAMSVQREPKRSRTAVYLPWAITAAMSLALIAVGVSGRGQGGDGAKLLQALPMLNDPATRDVAFGDAGAGSDKGVKGRVFVSPGRGVIVIAANLPHPDAGKVFEVWVAPAKGNAAPAGLFEAGPDGSAVFVRTGPVENAAAIEVTVEPAGGSTQPTGTPILAAKL